MLSRPFDEILRQFGVSNPRIVAETALSTVWKVDCSDGTPAALKIYHRADMRNESSGIDLLEALEGNGAARLLQRGDFSVLVEWLDGACLGDLTRSGADTRAASILVEVANRIHERKPVPPADVPQLRDWFENLFQLKVGKSFERSVRSDFAVAKSMSRDLLETQEDIVWLHGDLHHDNIRFGERGYCAFNAKGILGERTYELANAFRNPKGAEPIVRDPKRIKYQADLWSETFRVDRGRLLQWAAAKCALSIAWRSGETLRSDVELDLLPLLIKAAGRAG